MTKPKSTSRKPDLPQVMGPAAPPPQVAPPPRPRPTSPLPPPPPPPARRPASDVLNNVQVEKLRGRDDYFQWEGTVHMYLKAKGLHDILEFKTSGGRPYVADESMPTLAEAEALTDWNLRNAACVSYLFTHVDENNFRLIRGMSDAYVIWRRLKDEYDRNDVWAQTNALGALQFMRMSEGGDGRAL